MSSSTARRRPSSGDAGRSQRKRIRGHDEDVGHPIEDDDTAKRKLKEAGFDPESPSKPANELRGFPRRDSTFFTPMIYFSYKGDLPMCRYLLVHGTKADVTKRCSNEFWFPMYAAAWSGNVLLCQWLFDRGAAEDVFSRSRSGIWSPLQLSFHDGRENVCKWLILNGALHGRPDGAFDSEAAEFIFDDDSDEDDSDDDDEEMRGRQSQLLSSLRSWAIDTVACHASFRMFLLGTLPLPDDCTEALATVLSRDLRSEKAAMRIIEKTLPEDHTFLLQELSSPLHTLGGFPEILEHIADFVGIVKRRRERDRLRDLANFFCESSTP